MNKDNGAISIFALLAMMFFLIFIMVAYNNVAQKGRTQVETEGVLTDYYKSTQTATEIVNSKTSSIEIGNSNKTDYLKEEAQQNSITDDNSGKYVYSNGQIYKIQ